MLKLDFTSLLGRDMDILIGSKYLQIHPQLVWKAPSGLIISDSLLTNPDRTSGVAHGLHPDFEMSISQGNNAFMSVTCLCDMSTKIYDHILTKRVHCCFALMKNKPEQRSGDVKNSTQHYDS